jgi:uncharacterized protein
MVVTALLRDLRPVLHPTVVCYCLLPTHQDVQHVPWIGLFRESEGLTVIVAEETARQRGWPVMFRAAWITLTIQSGLSAVGLTAAVSGALAEAGISCNVVAAVGHDHLFVPIELGPSALSVLEGLQRAAQQAGNPST